MHCRHVHAFCLMRNHYHVVAETPNANLVAGKPAWIEVSCRPLGHLRLPEESCT